MVNVPPFERSEVNLRSFGLMGPLKSVVGGTPSLTWRRSRRKRGILLPSFKQQLACRRKRTVVATDAVATSGSQDRFLRRRLLGGDDEAFSSRRIFMSADAIDHPRHSNEDSSACSRALGARPGWAWLILPPAFCD